MISSKEFSFVSSLSILFSFFNIVCLSTIHLNSATGALSKCVHSFWVKLEYGSVGFWGVGKTRKPGENLSAQGENQQQTLPTSDAKSGDQTWATFVGGSHSHDRATPVPNMNMHRR